MVYSYNRTTFLIYCPFSFPRNCPVVPRARLPRDMQHDSRNTCFPDVHKYHFKLEHFCKKLVLEKSARKLQTKCLNRIPFWTASRLNQRKKTWSLNSGEPATSSFFGMAAWKTGEDAMISTCKNRQSQSVKHNQFLWSLEQGFTV